MTNPSKQKGTAAETLVVGWLRANGRPYVERRALAGRFDLGDVIGIPGVVVEVKAEKSLTIPSYLRELDVEMDNAGATTGTVIAKRRGTLDVGEWFAIQPVRVWHALTIAAGY